MSKVNPPTFHDFWFGMDTAKRPTFAKRVSSSVGYLERVAGGFSLPSFSFATRLVRAAKGALTYESILAPYEAKNGKVA